MDMKIRVPEPKHKNGYTFTEIRNICVLLDISVIDFWRECIFDDEKNYYLPSVVESTIKKMLENKSK